jgi:hypothetical protein
MLSFFGSRIWFPLLPPGWQFLAQILALHNMATDELAQVGIGLIYIISRDHECQST